MSHFVFPNLTSFKLSVAILEEEWFRGSQLLDFLEASPMLRAVRMKIITPISLEDIPQEKVVILHHVENFRLFTSDDGYKLATHISCPSAKRTSLTRTHGEEYFFDPPLEKLPASASLNAIIRQYTSSPIEEVTLETKTAYPPIRVLTISDPLNMLSKHVAAGLVKLARKQHELGVAFDRVLVHMDDPPADMEERLRPWVGTVDCCGVP